MKNNKAIKATQLIAGISLLIGNIIYLPILAMVSLISIPLFVLIGALRGFQEYIRELSSVMNHRTWCFKKAEELITWALDK